MVNQIIYGIMIGYVVDAVLLHGVHRERRSIILNVRDGSIEVFILLQRWMHVIQIINYAIASLENYKELIQLVYKLLFKDIWKPNCYV